MFDQAPFVTPLGGNKFIGASKVFVDDLFKNSVAFLFWMTVVLFYNDLRYTPSITPFIAPVIVLGALVAILRCDSR